MNILGLILFSINKLVGRYLEMGLSCRAWTGSQISLLFGLEGLVQDCFELYFGFKGVGIKEVPSDRTLSVLS